MPMPQAIPIPPKKSRNIGNRDLGTDISGFDYKIDHRQGPDGIGHIVGALGQGDVAGGSDLGFF